MDLKEQFKIYCLSEPDKNKWIIFEAEHLSSIKDDEEKTRIKKIFLEVRREFDNEVNIFKDKNSNVVIQRKLSKEMAEKWWNDIGERFIEDNKDYALYIEDEQSDAVTIVKYTGSVYIRLSSLIQRQSLIYKYFNLYSQKKYKTKNNIGEAWLKIRVALFETGAIYTQPDPFRINFKNGLYNIKTKDLEEHNQKYFTLDQIPLEYDKDYKEMPLWENHLSMISQGDRKMVDMIQEMFGYVIFSVGNKAHKMHYLYGKLARNGKSTTLKVLEMLVGHSNIAKLSLDELSNISSGYNASELVGKKLCISEEGEDVYLKSDSITNLTSEGELQINRKYETPYKAKITANFVAASNYLPRFKDSAGMDNRLILIDFPYQIPVEDRVMGFEDKVAEHELPAILNWAAEGYERIEKQGFTISTDSVKLAKKVKSGASSVVDYWNFLIDNNYLLIGKDFEEPISSFYSTTSWGDDIKTYNEFYKNNNNGNRYSMAKTKFKSETEKFWADYNRDNGTDIVLGKRTAKWTVNTGMKFAEGNIDWDNS